MVDCGPQTQTAHCQRSPLRTKLKVRKGPFRRCTKGVFCVPWSRWYSGSVSASRSLFKISPMITHSWFRRTNGPTRLAKISGWTKFAAGCRAFRDRFRKRLSMSDGTADCRYSSLIDGSQGPPCDPYIPPLPQTFNRAHAKRLPQGFVQTGMWEIDSQYQKAGVKT